METPLTPNEGLTRKFLGIMWGYRGLQKKSEPERTKGSDTGDESDSLEAFRDRLRERCAHDSRCHGIDRSTRIQSQAEHAAALAAELGLLITSPYASSEFSDDGQTWKGSEHYVEFWESGKRYAKTTIPPSFGLIPEIREFQVADLRAETSMKQAIEFMAATPLEYLDRWILANDVFGDDVRLASVIRWKEGEVSFGITQPQYHGRPAEPREIEEHFMSAGWERIGNPSGHAVFYNFAFHVIAIDAESRNCYIKSGNLLPFDVILREPDERLARYLRIL